MFNGLVVRSLVLLAYVAVVACYVTIKKVGRSYAMLIHQFDGSRRGYNAPQSEKWFAHLNHAVPSKCVFENEQASREAGSTDQLDGIAYKLRIDGQDCVFHSLPIVLIEITALNLRQGCDVGVGDAVRVIAVEADRRCPVATSRCSDGAHCFR